MDLQVGNKTYVVFDLDDTLYAERDFVISGFHHIERLLSGIVDRPIIPEMMSHFDAGEDVLGWLIKEFRLAGTVSKEELLSEYRTHSPTISLYAGAAQLLSSLRKFGARVGLLTDGRSITQRNKIDALGISNAFDDVIISEEFGSEKPNVVNYTYFSDKYIDCAFTLIADNTAKDFTVPALLGWTTVCLRAQPTNIHSQNLSEGVRIDYVVNSLAEIQAVAG